MRKLPLPALLFICASFLIPLTTGSARSAEPAMEPMKAFQKDARILFQGDSITGGNRGRNADPNFIIAAKFGAGYADRNLTFINRGVSGNTVRELDKRWKADTLDLKPDLLSVLIGVNDTSRNIPMEEYEQTYDKLLADARAANPKLKLVLCDPFGLPVGPKKNDWAKSSESLKERQAVVAKLAKKYDAVVVPFQKAFDEACKRAPAEHWIWDGVHPTYSGHQIMADEWVKTVNEFFK